VKKLNFIIKKQFFFQENEKKKNNMAPYFLSIFKNIIDCISKYIQDGFIFLRKSSSAGEKNASKTTTQLNIRGHFMLGRITVRAHSSAISISGDIRQVSD
jgi:hypothetical protein